MSSLLENMKGITYDPKPFIDLERDLPFKKEYDVNSWFVIGHFDVEGETIDFLYHLMCMRFKGIPMMSACLTACNETTHWYGGEDSISPMIFSKADKNKFYLKDKTGIMSGDLNKMLVQAHSKDASVDIEMTAEDYPLYNNATGVFDFLGMQIHQYSIPHMKTTGTVTLKGKTYPVDGYSWFDRQFQVQGDGGLPGRWTWFDLNLSNGIIISVWDGIDSDGSETCWGTVLYPDGHHEVVDILPLSEHEYDFWKSTNPKSENAYPTRMDVIIPSLNAKLEVKATFPEQEIASVPGLAHYEATATVSGNFNGEEVTGYSFIELVGDNGWKAKDGQTYIND